MNTLYKYVSKDALPKEFGGSLDSMATYHSKCNDSLKDLQHEFTRCASMMLGTGY
jgi:hypothetical protein